MRLQQTWTNAVLALCVLSGAAFADVTVSHSNDPTSLIGTQFASLLGAEYNAVDAVPAAQLTAMAVGPKAAVSISPFLGTKAKKSAAKPEPVLVSYTPDWIATQPTASGDEQWQCLKMALYFEARGETIKGQFAVAEVILNRVDSPRYPKTVCGVVEQGGGGSCQFSFVCDGARNTMADPQAAETAGRIARVMLDGAPRGLTGGATYFHSRAVWPAWSKRFPRTASIGAHVFYRQP
jgi:spore germination cell wall hydrolase CwlJ-like protein